MTLVLGNEDAKRGAAPSADKTRRRRGIVAAHLFTLAALAAWWGYAEIVPPYQLPGPQRVAARMLDFLTQAPLAAQLGISLAHVAAALVISFVLGALLALAAHVCRPLRLLIEGRITPFLNAFSGIGWLFIAILWFGIDSTTVVFAVTVILLPFAIINLGTGLHELDRDLVEMGRSLSRAPLHIYARIVLPQLVPYAFATLRTSFGVAWKVVLAAELFGGDAGVGYMLNVARQEFDTETIFAIIAFILVFVAFAEIAVFRPAQRRLDARFGRG